MDPVIRNVLDCFEQINHIPRCSKKERQLADWLRQWAADRSFVVNSDKIGNLVIEVPATPGFETAPTIILQGHMDMVCEKNADSDHDFSTDPIQMVQDGDWLHAVDTTLGADNGIALALAMALVDSPEIGHPALELFFTVDEETGLTGAMQMDPALLSGRILVNLDSEEEGVFVIGCAGGRSTTLSQTMDTQPIQAETALLRITAEGMFGGHSGVDVDKHRANANKVMARLLGTGSSAVPFKLADLAGGTARNAIPRMCRATVACEKSRVPALKQAIEKTFQEIAMDFRRTEPDMRIRIEEIETAGTDHRVLSSTDTNRVIDLLAALPNGPVTMELDAPLLVRTSVNLGVVELKAGELRLISSQRSSIPSGMDTICSTVEAIGRLFGATVQTGDGYPSWPMNPESELVHRSKAVYRELFNAEPVMQTIHAGLECGIIGSRCPGMDMISMGPTIQNPHSPSERMYLPSVEKTWRLIVALLASYGQR